VAVLARSVTVGVLHPGEMGAAVGTQIRAAGHTVLWVSEGRSDATAKRAHDAGFDDAATTHELAGRCDVIVSVCPPHAAVDVARAFASFYGLYVDANAVSPATAREIASIVPRFVDGGIIGPPGGMRIYVSGGEAEWVAGVLGATVVSNASALKMAYAAWSKGTAALALAIWELAEAEGIRDELLAEWRVSQPQLEDRLASAERSARAKGWRWVGEMEQIADTFAADGLPDGFHRAAAEIFRRHS
jgi:3-hydroxyisobutyrate dehydrogenase-like beta-hydroxyacid dehydrogenase